MSQMTCSQTDSKRSGYLWGNYICLHGQQICKYFRWRVALLAVHSCALLTDVKEMYNLTYQG